MRKRRVILLILAGVLLVGVVWAVWPSNEPTYKGKKLSEWCEQLGSMTTVRGVPRPTVAPGLPEEAVRAIGTNAIPYLVKWIQYRPSPLPTKARQFVNATLKHLKIGWEWKNMGLARAEGARKAFVALGPRANSAIPEVSRALEQVEENASALHMSWALGDFGEPAMPYLMAALTNQRPEVRSAAASALSRQRTNARPAIPLLIQCLKDADESTATSAALTLGGLNLDPELVAPALSESLIDPRPKVRAGAALALARYPVYAQSAMPTLQRLLNDPDLQVRTRATNVIRFIEVQRQLEELGRDYR